MGYILFIIMFSLQGCVGALGKSYQDIMAGLHAETEIERGLSYIAAAIVIHAILQIIFRK